MKQKILDALEKVRKTIKWEDRDRLLNHALNLILDWKWDTRKQEWNLKSALGPSIATVWPNGTWHTWNKDGTGGENGTVSDPHRPYEDRHFEAKRQAWEALERQGWV